MAGQRSIADGELRLLRDALHLGLVGGPGTTRVVIISLTFALNPTHVAANIEIFGRLGGVILRVLVLLLISSKFCGLLCS